MLQFLTLFLGDRPQCSNRPAIRNCRLQLESLEDRLVPSSTPLDLTTAGAQQAVNGVIFQQGDVQPSGSGVIDSFVRIHALGGGGQEQGYNTSARPLQFNENSSPTFTRNLQLSQVPLVTIGTTNYRVFLLDVNQKSSAPLVSLDQLQIFLGTSGNATGYASRQLTGAKLIFDLNPNDGTDGNYVELDARLSHGSGSSDMNLCLPDSLFAGTSGDPYVYLFSRFGDHFGTHGGYEEWAVSHLTGAAPSSISGTVFDTSGGLISGVLLTLTGTDVNGNAVTLYAMTDNNGFYFFDSLVAGSYTVTVLTSSVPSGFSWVGSSVGTVGGMLSTQNGNHDITSIMLDAGLNGINYDFTFGPAAGGGVIA
jgi:hypothetical protein